jgi:hypothetical protein
LQVGEHAKKKKAPYNSASGVSCTVNLQEWFDQSTFHIDYNTKQVHFTIKVLCWQS